MMVAAHNDDLAAAAACGLMTAFVARPKEHGVDQTSDLAPLRKWTVSSNDFLELSGHLAHF